MLAMRENIFPHRREHRFKTCLGNTTPRYNSEVFAERKKYITNSTKNSEQVPDWMSRTTKYCLRSNNIHNRNNSVFVNSESAFMQTKQKWLYESINKSRNVSGQFQIVRNKRARTKWQMKGQTFQFNWPQKMSVPISKQATQPKQISSLDISLSRNKVVPFFKYQLPKYGLRQAPLHRQKQTQIKIGHPSLIDSIEVK